MSIATTLFITVFLTSALGIFFVRWMFANRPDWQDFVCRFTLVTTLLLPAVIVCAVVLLPNGLIHLPILKASPAIENSVGAERDSLSAEKLAYATGLNSKPLQSNSALGESPQSAGRHQDEPSRNDGAKTVFPSQDMESASLVYGKSNSGNVDRAGTWYSLTNLLSQLSVVGWGFLIWITGSLILTVYFAVGWAGLFLLRKSVVPVTAQVWVSQCQRISARLNLNKPPSIACSPNVSTPLIVGIANPLILIPTKLIKQESPVDEIQVNAILSHEAMHIKRRDTSWNLLSCFAMILWWPVPTIHLLRSQMAWVRELLCDANAIQDVGATGYAETLLHLATCPQQKRLGVVALSMRPSARVLESRIRWILDRSSAFKALSGGPSPLMKRLVWVGMALTMVASVSIRFVAGNYIEAPAVAALQQEGSSVSGRVLKTGDLAVSDATVYLVELPEDYWMLPVDFVTQQTDESGVFEFSNVTPGNYMVWAEAEGLTSLEKILQGKRFVVKENEDPEQIDLQLIEGCNYRVHVTANEDGQPIANAEISFGWSDTGRTYQTDENGIADIQGLAQNTWYFVVKAEGFATTFDKKALQDLGTTTDIHFSLEPGSTIRGVVTDQNGYSVIDAEVYCTTDEIEMAPSFGKVTTNMQGEYEIHGVPRNHKLRVSTSPDGYERQLVETSVDLAEELAEVDLVCKKLPYGGDVIVSVVDEDGLPIEGAELFNRGTSSGDVRTATTDAEGKGRLVNMYEYDGAHTVAVRAEGKMPTHFNVEPGPVKEPGVSTIELKKGRTLRGQLVTPEGKPAANVSVFLYEVHRPDFGGCKDLKWPRLRTDAEGRFESNEMLDGNTSITVYTPKQYAPIESLEVQMEGEQTEITIKMEPAAQLRVRAVDSESGDPIPSFNVKLARVESGDMLEGDVPCGGIEVSMMNPGTNVHGSTKEFTLEGQAPNVVYRLIVSAEGYETFHLPRIRCEVEEEVTNVRLVKSK